jgi:hypothetical protein
MVGFEVVDVFGAGQVVGLGAELEVGVATGFGVAESVQFPFEDLHKD